MTLTLPSPTPGVDSSSAWTCDAVGATYLPSNQLSVNAAPAAGSIDPGLSPCSVPTKPVCSNGDSASPTFRVKPSRWGLVNCWISVGRLSCWMLLIPGTATVATDAAQIDISVSKVPPAFGPT